MDMDDPDIERSNQVLLEVVPFVGGDGCPTGWLETDCFLVWPAAVLISKFFVVR